MSKHNKKILVVGPAWVGDAVMAQSLYKAMIQSDQVSEIAVVTPDAFGPLLQRMPEVNRVISLPVQHGQLALAKRWRLGHSLRTALYDEAYVLPRSFKSALLPWFARVPVRKGHVGEMRYGVLTQRFSLARNKSRPNVLNYLQLLCIDVQIETVLRQWAPQLRTENVNQESLQQQYRPLKHPSLVALMPGAEFGPSKQWPVKYFAELAARLQKEGHQVVILASPKEKQLAGIIAKQDSAILDLAGRTRLVDAVDILALCRAAVSNDSGLMHIAAAVNCPVVALYGSTSPAYTPPLAANARVLYLQLECSPCWQRDCRYGHYRCLADISVERVFSVLGKCMKL